MVVGRLLSYWEGNFSGAMLNFVRVSFPFNKKTCLYHVFFTWQSESDPWRDIGHIQTITSCLLEEIIFFKSGSDGGEIGIWHKWWPKIIKYAAILKFDAILSRKSSYSTTSFGLFLGEVAWGCYNFPRIVWRMHFLRKKRCCSKLLLVKVARILKKSEHWRLTMFLISWDPKYVWTSG